MIVTNPFAPTEEIGPGGSSDTKDKKRYTDPLADDDSCKRDVPLLKELNTNTIRVYAIDPKANHDTCMKLLADAGIYVIADLSQPDQSINRDDPHWNDDLYSRYTSVIDALIPYNNVLGFFAGNEVSNAKNNTDASAFVKASVRDTKAYVKSKKYREVGIGYATNDDADIRSNLAAYFNCGNAEDSVDFWGYNIYSWCGQSSYTKSGFDVRTKEFSKYNVPVFFAEYGCNEVRPRPFTEVQALYGSDMSPVWSGGIVYMYFEEPNKYGLVKVGDDKKASKLPDFKNLSSQMSKVSPSSTKFNDYKPTNTAASSCPAVDSNWEAKSSPLPPPVNPDLCTCMMDTLSCTVADNVDTEDYGKLFGEVCGYGDDICAGIAANATTGNYGAYSICNAREQLSFVFNRYYLKQNKKADACKFDGAAKTVSAKSPAGTCKSLVDGAGDNGQNTPSGSTGGGKGGDKDKDGAGNVVQVGAYLAVAIFAGAAMFVL